MMFSRFKSAAAMGAITFLFAATPASAITFNLSWKGQTLGYSASGQFSYDDTTVPDDGIVRSGDIDSLDISFFTPEGSLLKAFENNQETPGFNFNFNTTTGEILQSGRWDTPEGISIGDTREQGLNMFSVPNPKANLFGDDEPSPHTHLTDWANEFPNQPIGFTRGARPHLDIAFPTRTRAEVLADPSAGDELGEQLIATLVEDP